MSIGKPRPWACSAAETAAASPAAPWPTITSPAEFCFIRAITIRRDTLLDSTALTGDGVVAAALRDQRTAVEINDRSGHEADGHEGEDLPRDIVSDADTANRQRGGSLG